jgi:hypothetical protein
MSKHTPGPWKFHKQARTIAIFTASNADTVASVPISQIVDNTRREADARLIAAAPELLEALKAALYLGDFRSEAAQLAWAKALDVIAKATGEQA